MEIDDFLDELTDLADRTHLHLEAIEGELFAVDDRPGTEPVPVDWDEESKRYGLIESD